jgi:hypothetical protein
MPTQFHAFTQRILGPADRLISRLWYLQKFVLIGLVLILPLGWVVKSGAPRVIVGDSRPVFCVFCPESRAFARRRGEWKSCAPLRPVVDPSRAPVAGDR